MEARLNPGRYFRALAWAAFTSFNQWLCETFRIRIADYDGRKYRDELVAYTDFRKYDGVFRAVLNVTEAQAAEIELYLVEREDGHECTSGGG